MANETYQAGVARADITPPIGIWLAGYAVREGVSHGIDEPLTATALVLRAADTTVVLLALDIAMAYVEFTTQMRECCGRVLGIPPANVLINFNHTHSAPAPPNYIPYDTPDQLEMQAQYTECLLAQIQQACRDAAANLQPARIAAGWGECRGNINRRQKSADGTVLMGENPDGPCDPSVGVVRVDDLHGKALAVLFRYSCHTVTLGPRTNLISPDFPGVTRALIERELGCLSLFLQGCAGNVNPATGLGVDAEGVEEKRRLGHLLGGEVLKVCQSLRTHRRRKAPVLVQSIAVYWLYEYEDIPPGAEGSIQVAETWMELPLVPFPALAEVQREREEWAARLAEAQQRNAREWEWKPLERFDYWAQLRLDAAQNGSYPAMVKFPLQVIRVGEMAFVAMPFETMAETGLALREAAPHTDTFVLGYSNGMVSYLPTPEISAEGGMEARLAYKNYLLPAELPGDWEPQIKERFLKLLETTQ